MKMPKVSVVMPSYNHASFVREAIESVLTQSFQDIELVITDDGSRDGTVEVIRSVADPRIRLHAFTENQGACPAMNDAITRARGEYIAVLNSDDYFLPGKLQSQVDFLEAHPEIGAVFGLPQFVDERGKDFRDTSHAFLKVFTDINQSRLAWLKHFFYKGNCLCHPTVMLRKACYAKAGLFDPLLMQLPDLDMWVRICCAFEIHVLPEKLTAFRVLDREQNVSAPTNEKLSRVAWETVTVLEHYLALSEPEMREIVSGSDHVRDVRVRMALAAIELGQPGYIQFGLDLLRKCMRMDSRSYSPSEYFKLVGETDPYAIYSRGRTYRFLKSVRALARRAYRRLRTLR